MIWKQFGSDTWRSGDYVIVAVARFKNFRPTGDYRYVPYIEAKRDGRTVRDMILGGFDTSTEAKRVVAEHAAERAKGRKTA